jgi:hypothetical protein
MRVFVWLFLLVAVAHVDPAAFHLVVATLALLVAIGSGRAN